MALLVDALVTYPIEMQTDFPSTTWCYLVSDQNHGELVSFLPQLGVAPGRLIQRPAGKAEHVRLSGTERASAIAAGASTVSGREGFGRNFDAPQGRRGPYV